MNELFLIKLTEISLRKSNINMLKRDKWRRKDPGRKSLNIINRQKFHEEIKKQNNKMAIRLILEKHSYSFRQFEGNYIKNKKSALFKDKTISHDISRLPPLSLYVKSKSIFQNKPTKSQKYRTKVQLSSIFNRK